MERTSKSWSILFQVAIHLILATQAKDVFSKTARNLLLSSRTGERKNRIGGNELRQLRRSFSERAAPSLRLCSFRKFIRLILTTVLVSFDFNDYR